MIKINLSPVRGTIKTTLSVDGSVVTLNNVDYDLSLLGDGGEALHKDLGVVTRNGNDYEITVVIYHAKDASESVRFPAPLTVNDQYTHEYDAGEF